MAEKLIALSFDDGRDQDFDVITLFSFLHIPATFYLTALNVSERKTYSHNYSVKEITDIYLQPGFEVGCHGYSHFDMEAGGNDPRRRIPEVIEARDSLEDLFITIDSYAFPYGKSTEEFAIWVSDFFESCRLYQTHYPWSVKKVWMPEGIITFDLLKFDPSKHVDGDVFLHFAGHAGDVLRLPKKDFFDWQSRAKDNGWEFVTARDFYRRRKLCELP